MNEPKPLMIDTREVLVALLSRPAPSPLPSSAALRELAAALLRWQLALRLPTPARRRPRRRVPMLALRQCVRVLQARPELARELGLDAGVLGRLVEAAGHLRLLHLTARGLRDDLEAERLRLHEAISAGHGRLGRVLRAVAAARGTDPATALRLRTALGEAGARPLKKTSRKETP